MNQFREDVVEGLRVGLVEADQFLFNWTFNDLIGREERAGYSIRERLIDILATNVIKKINAGKM